MSPRPLSRAFALPGVLLASLLASCLARAEPAVRAESAPASAEIALVAQLLAQPDASAAQAWLHAEFPLRSYVGDELDFLASADEILIDPAHPDVRLFVYLSSTSAQAGHSGWIAWLGLDEDWFVVFLDTIPLE